MVIVGDKRGELVAGVNHIKGKKWRRSLEMSSNGGNDWENIEITGESGFENIEGCQEKKVFIFLKIN